MQFIDSIFDLDYYRPLPAGVPCYCETVNIPNEMRLQSDLDYNGSGTYTYLIEAYQPNGQTLLGDVTSYFTITQYTNVVTGLQGFTLVLKGFAPVMCANACFVLHVYVSNGAGTYFNKYTQKYCVPNCCEYATEIIATQDNVTGGGIMPQNPTTIVDADTCGKSFRKLETFSDCYNAFSGRYYKDTGYKNISQINARLVETPTSIERTYSLNCRPQQFQMQRTFTFESHDIIPAWKMVELTQGFGDQYIFVDGTRYEMLTDTPFEVIQLPNICDLYYKLNATLVHCNIKQIYGCGTACTENTVVFAFSDIQGDVSYYNENRQFIGSDCDELMNYYRTYPDVTDVTPLDPNDYSCSFECGFMVTAAPNVSIPSYFFVNGTAQGNRIYGQSPAFLADLCTAIAPSCIPVVVGIVSIETVTCATPIIGDVTITDEAVTDIYITGYSDWIVIDAGTDAVLSNGVVSMSIEMTNVNYPLSGSPAAAPFISERIGTVSEAGRPTFTRNITNPTLDAVGAFMQVNTDGSIYYVGQLTSATFSYGEVNVTDINYII
jgi:hypothetical protein